MPPRKRALPRFHVGVDLGQANDYTALCVVERAEDGAWETLDPVSGMDRGPTYHVRWLERFRDVPYTVVADRVAELVRSPALKTTFSEQWDRVMVEDALELPPTLTVDATGVGRGVVDMLKARGLKYTAVTITSGRSVTRNGPYRGVPKADLVSGLQVSLQNGWLKIAAGLEHAETLRDELLNYRLKVTPAGNETYEAWRDRDHDDLVLACAMACYGAALSARRGRIWRTGNYHGGVLSGDYFGQPVNDGDYLRESFRDAVRRSAGLDEPGEPFEPPSGGPFQ